MVEIRKGFYGLPQASILAYNLLCARFAVGNYYPTHQIVYSLLVDDFGIKYIKKRDVEHLLTLLGLHYTMKVDWHLMHQAYMGLYC